jgi:GNAT superfamily N-acetyltransferase
VPAIAIVRGVCRLIPFRPFDVARLRFLTFAGVPRVPAAMLRGRAQVRAGTRSDIPGLALLQQTPEIFAARFDDGDHCVVAVAAGRVVGYEWFCDRSIHREAEWGYPIPVPAGSVYAYDAYIDRAYRNSGLWLRFKAYLGDWMAMHGKQQVITFVDDGNEASWRTHLRFGFRPADTVLAVRILGRRIFRKTSSSPQPAASLRSMMSPAARS